MSLRSEMKPTHRRRCDRRETVPELIDTQGASFLDDESEVMGQMLNRAVDHLVYGPIAAIANDSRPLPRFRWRGPQDAADLPPRQVEDAQFLLDVAVMVREGGQHQLRLDSIEYWSLLRQDALDPMGDIGIGVGQMADDLQHAPSPGDGPRDHLLAANAGNGRPEYPGAGKIGVEQGDLFHLGLPPARLGLKFNLQVLQRHGVVAGLCRLPLIHVGSSVGLPDHVKHVYTCYGRKKIRPSRASLVSSGACRSGPGQAFWISSPWLKLG